MPDLAHSEDPERPPTERGFLRIFLETCRGQLAEMEQIVLTLTGEPASEESALGILRVLHTLKGEAAVLALDTARDLCHAVEDLVEECARTGSCLPAEVVLSLVDWLEDYLDRLDADPSAPPPGSGFLRARIAEATPRHGEVRERPRPMDYRRARVCAETKIEVSLPVLDRLVELAEAIRTGPEDPSTAERARELLEAARSVRVTTLAPTFQRIERLARSVCRELERSIELEFEGEQIPLDPHVVQGLNSPLVHLVLNAIDHGIEDPADRTARGKPPAGKITLTATRQGNSLVVEVSDDGRGFHRSAILERAEAAGLLPIGPRPPELSDEEVWKLLVQPGFSTADRITRTSGRGIGLDIVRQRVENLGGRIELASSEGMGARVRLRIPL